MVQALQVLMGIYKERLMAMPTAPIPSFGRSAFGVDSAVNRLFLTLEYYRWCILYTSFSYFCLTSIYVNLPSPSSIYPQFDSLRR